MSGDGNGGGFLAKLRAYASPLDMGIGGLALLVLCIWPLVADGGFRFGGANIILFLGVYLVLALGLNVVVGFTGLLDLGYVVFMVSGAVCTTFLMSLVRTPEGTIDWAIGTSEPIEGTPVLGFEGSVFLMLLASGLLCAVLGFLRGIPTLRVRGDYFAIVTLGIAEIMFETFLWSEDDPINFASVTGGAFSANVEDGQLPVLFGEPMLWSTPAFYYVVLGVLVLTFALCHHVNRSRVGRAFAAIRMDETAARACGVDVARYKLIAFTVSGFVGGLGGSLYAVWKEGVTVRGLDVWQSILILSCVVLGGMGSLRGVAVGTIVFMGLGEWLREGIPGVPIPPESRFLVYGLLLIVFMRFRPQGILPPVRRGRPVGEHERGTLLGSAARLFTLGRDEGGAS